MKKDNKNVKRFVVPSEGPNSETIKIAFGFLIEICEKHNIQKDLVLFIPTKKHIRGTILENVIGEKASKALFRNEPVKLIDDNNIILRTPRNFNVYPPPEFVISIYPDEEMLDMIDEIFGMSIAIVVPYKMDDIKHWVRTWNPEIVGERQSITEERLLEPEVEKKLEILTKSINLGTGLSHSLDKRKAVEISRKLKAEGYNLDPDAIKSWALRHKWLPHGANQLKDIVIGVNKGKRFRLK